MTIQQLIFAEFINIGEIEKAIEWAEEKQLTEQEQIEAIENMRGDK